MTNEDQGVNARTSPKKPETMAEFWPADGRKEFSTKDGFWLRYRDLQIGPFPNRKEAHWYDGQVQEIIMGWMPKEYFAGRIFKFGDAWYVERWEHNDGPCASYDEARVYRQGLYLAYRQEIERTWENHTGTKAPTYSVKDNQGETGQTSGSGFGRMSESGRVHVNSEGKVVISGRDSENATDEEVEFCSDSHCDCSKFMQAKKATDEINFNSAQVLGETRLVIPESLRGKSAFVAASGWTTDGDIQEWEKNLAEFSAECGGDDENATDDETPMTSLTDAISEVLTRYRTSEPRIQAEEVVDLLIEGGWVAE